MITTPLLVPNPSRPVIENLIHLSLQIEELNSSIQSYCATISEKDAKLSELQSKLENASVDQREQELFKQIAEYKEKNNVSKRNSN